MGNILGLNKKTAINLLDNLSNELFIQYGFPCKLYGHMPIFIARTYNDDDGYYSGIGLYGFAFASSLDFLGRAVYFQLCIKQSLQANELVEFV